jgi:hypothetical protein
VSEFQVDLYANFGTGEPWVARLVVGLPKVVDATTLGNRDEIKLAISDVYEALTDAFNDLRELRRIEGDASIPVAERQGTYSAFYVHLWRAYKDRFQKLLQVLGYDLGFLWQSQKQFEAAAERFIDQHPEIDVQFVDALRENRRSWQDQLGLFRNHLEHREETPDQDFDASFYTLQRAEQAFEYVWRMIENISAQLLVPHLFPGLELVEIPEAERDPAAPLRFEFNLTEPLPEG